MCKPEKKFLREDLKTLKDSDCLISEGREFQSFGATEEKAQSPIERKRFRGIVKRPESEEQRLRLGVYTVKSSVRYSGAKPCKAL